VYQRQVVSELFLPFCTPIVAMAAQQCSRFFKCANFLDFQQLSQQGCVQVVAEDESVRDFYVYVFFKLLGLLAAIG